MHPIESSLRGRHVRIGIPPRAERSFERTEPGLEVPPMIHSVPENRPPHLLRTRGTHRALVLIKAQALVFERQAAICEEPPHFGLGILDHLLVKCPMHVTG